MTYSLRAGFVVKSTWSGPFKADFYILFNTFSLFGIVQKYIWGYLEGSLHLLGV